MKIKIKKISIGTIAFYIFWIILLVGKGLGYTAGDQVFRIITWIAIIFAIVKLVCTQWTRNQLITCILLNLLGIFVWFSSGDSAVLLTTIAVTSLKNININKLLKTSFWIKGSIYVVRVTLAILGFADKQVLTRYFPDGTYTLRYSLGYQQPNTAHYLLFVIVALCILVYRNRLKLFHYILMMLGNFFIFSFTDSRAGLLMTSLLILLAFTSSGKSRNLIVRGIEAASGASYFICAVTSFLICFAVTKIEFLTTFGTLYSRFNTASTVITNNIIPLFGSPNITTDFGYINILYGYGLIVWFIYVFGNTKLTKVMRKNNMVLEQIVLMCYAIYTLAEAYSTSILMNLSLVYFASILYPTNIVNVDSKKGDAKLSWAKKV